MLCEWTTTIPIQILDSIYHTVATNQKGDKLYLAMEPLSEDRDKWDLYRNFTTLLINGGTAFETIGSLGELATCINNNTIDEFKLKYKDSRFWFDETSEQLEGTSVVEFNGLAQKLKNFNSHEQLKSTCHALNGINIRTQTHIVYASKKPINGSINFHSNSKQGWGRYVELYDDLIMCVGVNITNIAENRGIFRNPISIINKDFSNISLLIHSFTCKVIREYFPEVQMFKIRPLKKMAEILYNTLPKELFTINDLSPYLYQGNFKLEEAFFVSVSVMANM